MTVKREYQCDLCHEPARPGNFGVPELIGLQWTCGKLTENPMWRSVEHHICPECLCALQSFIPVCGGGMRGCKGGPACQSDHK
jgi:cytochrome c peroxidase